MSQIGEMHIIKSNNRGFAPQRGLPVAETFSDAKFARFTLAKDSVRATIFGSTGIRGRIRPMPSRIAKAIEGAAFLGLLTATPALAASFTFNNPGLRTVSSRHCRGPPAPAISKPRPRTISLSAQRPRSPARPSQVCSRRERRLRTSLMWKSSFTISSRWIRPILRRGTCLPGLARPPMSRSPPLPANLPRAPSRLLLRS